MYVSTLYLVTKIEYEYDVLCPFFSTVIPGGDHPGKKPRVDCYAKTNFSNAIVTL